MAYFFIQQSSLNQSDFDADQRLADSPTTADRLLRENDDVMISDDATANNINVSKSKDIVKAKTVATMSRDEVVQVDDVKKLDFAEYGDARKPDDGESEESLQLDDKPENGTRTGDVADDDAPVDPVGNMEANAVMKTGQAMGVGDTLKTAATVQCGFVKA